MEEERKLINEEEANKSNCCNCSSSPTAIKTSDIDIEEKKKNLNSDKLDLRLIESDIGINLNQYSMYSQPREALEQSNLEGFDFKSIDGDDDTLPSLLQKVHIKVYI